MSRNIEDLFGPDFLNASVTISVREMSEIICHQMHDLCGASEDDSVDMTPELQEILLTLLREFGASIMTEMFSCAVGVDDIEIVPDDE